jgi:hypothetical protein
MNDEGGGGDCGGSGSSKQIFLFDYRDSGMWFRKQQ